MPEQDLDLLALTADIVSAHVANNSVHTGQVAPLIQSVYEALAALGTPTATEESAPKPQAATTVRKSLSSASHILSMIDGKPYKMLRRHIAQHGYTPESYREAFDLPRDYPMVASDYTETRRALAHKIGLGRKAGTSDAATPAGDDQPDENVAAEAPAAKPRRRKLKPSFGAEDQPGE